MTKDDRDPKEVYKTFRQHTEKWAGLHNLDNALNGSCTDPSRAQSFAERKANARRQAIEAFGLNPGASDSEVNNFLGAEAELARGEQTQYYTGNLEAILEGIPAGNLEKKALEIQPHEIGSNPHDKIAQLHKTYLGYTAMLAGYQEGKAMNSRAEREIRSRIAQKAAKGALGDDEIKKRLAKLGIGEKEVAGTLIYWAHTQHAYSESEGDREGILREGDKVLTEIGNKVVGALKEANYAPKDYALANLRTGANKARKSGDPEAVQEQIGLAYGLGKAA